MATAWALQRLRSFLIGIKFVIVTDCQCLINLNAWKSQNAQMARWISAISEHDFEIKHRKGELMKNVDTSSRAPVAKLENCERESVFTIVTREDEILAFQRSDSNILQKIKILQKPENERNNFEKGHVNDYILREGLLYKKKCVRENEIRELYVVPQAMRKALVIRYHDLGSHFGVEKTVKRMSEYYYFTGMKRYVGVHIRNCFECLLAKRKTGKVEGGLHPIPPGRRPFDIVNMDHLGPFPTSLRKKIYFRYNIIYLSLYIL